jgi:DNA helicase-2/ATP-dependent DNA helicase PcrA
MRRGAQRPSRHHRRHILGDVPDPLDGLTSEQLRAVTHSGGALLMLGGAGTGKTRSLAARFVWLATTTAPEAILVLTASAAAADELRARLEDALGDRAFEELAVHTVPAFCARLLHDEAQEAGLDPFVASATPADRLALLLERVDDLTLRLHDFRGNPAALLASVIARIDRLKEAMIGAAQYARWAEGLAGDDPRAEHEREFAGLYEAHDRMLAEQGSLDFGDLVLRAHALLRDRQHVRDRVAARFRHVLVDEYQELTVAQTRLVSLLAGRGPGAATLTAAGDDDQSLSRSRIPSTRDLEAFGERHPGAQTVRLERSLRCPQAILDAAAAVVTPIEDRIEKRLDGEPGGAVRFWRCENERAQAQGVARAIERALREGALPDDIAVLVRSVRNEGRAVAVALEERAIPYRLAGAAALFGHAEVRDVLAWLRLLVDPGDAGAVVRALARPPIELRAIDLARCIQIARRRKLDMVSALVAATESPQLPPEARERVLSFLKLHRSASAALDTARPDLFASSTASACAASSCSRPSPTSSRAWSSSRASGSSRRPTCGGRRRAPRASSPAI